MIRIYNKHDTLPTHEGYSFQKHPGKFSWRVVIGCYVCDTGVCNGSAGTLEYTPTSNENKHSKK